MCKVLFCFLGTAMVVFAADKKIITFDGSKVDVVYVRFICSTVHSFKLIAPMTIRALLFACRTQHLPGGPAMILSWFEALMQKSDLFGNWILYLC